MATTTPNLGLTKPTVGADADAWGGQLNASLDTLDAKVLDKTTGGTVSGAVNVIAATTAPAVRITQTGTGEALRVEDEANPDASPFVIDAAGNVGVSTIPPAATVPGIFFGAVGNAVAGNNSALLLGNGYIDGANVRYRTSKFATQYEQDNLNGAHRFFTAPSGTAGATIAFGDPKMTLTQGGNLLVGTTSDQAKLTVSGRVLAGVVGNSDNTYALSIAPTTAGDAVFNISGIGNALTFRSGNNANQTLNAEFARITGGGYFKASNTGTYIDAAASFHELRGAGATETLIVDNTTSGSAATLVHTRAIVGAFTGFHFLAEVQGAGTVYRVLANGNVQNTNNSYGAISDIKLKENVTDATPKLASLNQLRVVNYNLIGSELKQIGLIAQEVEQVFPGLVESTPDVDPETKEPTGTVTKSVKYSVLVPMLLKAVQELSAQNAALESRLAALEQK